MLARLAGMRSATYVRPMGWKFLAMAISLVVGVVNARLLVSTFGAAEFGVISLIATLPAMLPQGDVGLGVYLGNRLAARQTSNDDLASMVRATVAVVATVAFAVGAVGCLLAERGIAGSLLGLGEDEGSARCVAGVVIISSVNIIAGLGYRILIGLDETIIASKWSPVSPLAALALTVMGIRGHGSPLVVALAFPLGLLVHNLLIVYLAGRRLSDLHLWTMSASDRRYVPAILRSAAPMAVIVIAQPMVINSDRAVISHQLGVPALAVYAFASTAYTPLLTLLNAGAITLWPKFISLRHAPVDLLREWRSAQLGFLAIGGASAAVLVLLGPPLCSWLGAQPGKEFPVLLAFAALLLVQAAAMPGCMFLTDPAGLRFQAAQLLAMAGVNLPLSIWLAGRIGPGGPIVASAVAVAGCQLVPGRRRVRRDLRRRSGSSRPVLERAGVGLGGDEG